MVVSTLPVIGGTPYNKDFFILEIVEITVVWGLVIMAFINSVVLLLSVMCKIYNVIPERFTNCNCTCSCATVTQHLPSCCSRSCIKTAFLFVGRRLCVQTFPALFKMHKTRTGNEGQTREFMVFLDRSVEDSLALIVAFCSIVYSIFCSSAMAFLRYFPVEESTECLEKDRYDRPLFCYLNNSSIMDPSLPVDCANYSVTELQELEFQCYTVAIPGGLGIAVAAALGLAKIAILGITIFVKVAEGFFKKTRNPQNCCHFNRKCVNKMFVTLNIILLMSFSVVSLYLGFRIVISFEETKRQPLHILYYYAYIFLPFLICGPLAYIIYKLEAHCNRGEYVSVAADQRPPDEHDGESQPSVTESAVTEKESMHTGFEVVSVNGEDPDENEETGIIGGNTHEYGATTQEDKLKVHYRLRLL